MLSSASAQYGTFQGSRRANRRSPRWIAAAASLVLAAAVVAVCFQSWELENNTDYVFSLLDAPIPAAPPAVSGMSPADLSDFLATLPEDMRALVNASVDPCFDFHEFACGAWESTAVIKPEKTSNSYTWDIAHDHLNEGLRAAVEEDTGLVGNFYHACANKNLSDALGNTPALPFINMINDIKDRATFATVLAELHKLNLDAFFGWYVATDHANATRTLMYITKGGLNLPDKDYYLDQSPEYEQHRQSYLAYLKSGMALFNYTSDQVQAIVDDTMTVETFIAASEHDEDNGYKLVDVLPQLNQAQLLSTLPEFDWRSYLASWDHIDFATQDALISLAYPKWLAAMDNYIKVTPLPVLQNYLRAHVMHFFAPMLSEPFLANMEQLDADLYGTSARSPRWKKCLGATQHAIPLAVGQVYVDKCVGASIKPAATTMLEEIRDAWNHNFDTVTWMTPEVRAAAKIKLAGINLEVAYPAEWLVYGFETTPSTYVDNSVKAFRFGTTFEFARLFRPVDRREWDSSPAEINAFYSNGVNGVFIPAGILQSPFFNTSYPLSRNYGSMGAIMGHELTHGFDNTGRKYDATGARRPWWDNSTIEHYRDGAKCITSEYDNFVTAGVHVQGNETLGENIADMGGLKNAYYAYVTKVGDQNAKPNDRRTFWTSFAQSWCSVEREKATRLQVLTDPHSPDLFRITGPLSQLPLFSTDFGCPAGSPMNPQSKCVLW